MGRKGSCGLRFVFSAAVVWVMVGGAFGETVYVDARNGLDSNPGTQDEPVKTIGRAAEKVNGSAEDGPTTIKVGPGVYALAKSVEVANRRSYSEKERLTIEATILPDEARWTPALMPVVLSVEDPREEGKLDASTETYAIKIGVSHVTIRGLRFLGNPLARNWHCCVSRVREDLNDLVVTQCVFSGDRDGLDIYCAALAAGDGFVVDHCIFRGCHACAVFWDGFGGVAGKRCAMRYCLVDGAHIAGVWTCRTAEDFEFHHNVVTRSEYFWIRERIEKAARYRIQDCVVTDNRHYSGYGVESGPTGETGEEVTFDERNVVKAGRVAVVQDKRARDYLHIVEGGAGSELGAGPAGR